MSISNSVLQNRYQVGQFRGADATGELYQATHLLSEKTVSLKAFFFSDEAQLKKFEDEARELVKVASPGLAGVHDFFREGDRFFIVSEFVTADDLSEVLEKEGVAFSPSRAMQWAMQIAEALNYLHNLEFSLIHANIRPQNLKLVGDSIILQDFGLAASFAGRTLLKLDSVDSSNAWNFVSPEQSAGRVEPLSDIYSLGATLYALMTNVIPPGGLIRAESVKRRRSDPLIPIGQLNPDVTPEIAEIVMQAMALDPYERRWGPISPEALRMDDMSDEPGLSETVTPASSTTGSLPSNFAAEPAAPTYLDENVQFTVYRPKTIVPQKWHSLLAFAHLSEKREDAGEDEPDPVKEVRKQAQAILGEQAEDYQNVTQDTLQAIPREGTLTFVPTMPGIEFNPPSRSFVWEESVHREDFRIRAAADRDRSVVKGRLSVFLGSILLADIPLSIRVDSRDEGKRQRSALEKTHARPYRKIFASYSHKDTDVVKQFEHYLEALGDKYLRDVTYLRAGETWNEKLEEMIVKADIFQLFWSSNSMNSPFVRQEWEYALSLQRPNFIRPTYWEEPLPSLAEKNLPPEELKRLHFQRIQSDQSAKNVVSQTPEPIPELIQTSVGRSAASSNKVGSAPASPSEVRRRLFPTEGEFDSGERPSSGEERSQPPGLPERSGRANAASKNTGRRDDSPEPLQPLKHIVVEKQPVSRQGPVPSAPTSSAEVSSRTNSASKEGSRPSEAADGLEVFWDKRPRETGRKGVGGLDDAPRYAAPRRRGVGGGREETDTSSFPPHMRVYLPQSSRSGAGGSSGAFGNLDATDRLEAGRSGGAGNRLKSSWSEPSPASKSGPPIAAILILIALGIFGVILFLVFK